LRVKQSLPGVCKSFTIAARQAASRARGPCRGGV